MIPSSHPAASAGRGLGMMIEDLDPVTTGGLFVETWKISLMVTVLVWGPGGFGFESGYT